MPQLIYHDRTGACIIKGLPNDEAAIEAAMRRTKYEATLRDDSGRIIGRIDPEHWGRKRPRWVYWFDRDFIREAR